ncbi:uncharacterized protein N7483_010859 [Penicillium malachiteum]|uniref:uncharacterized protein n=1 Tax=Penicillium malachiteum TaxID=1324776 RepID=UPI002546C097|nr:uncharacterized protein N7483_010859 [Penicillium malachiteum]KAJ5713678.1 hypothetical protein N7483_010859 [Penicillium malachiteum]
MSSPDIDPYVELGLSKEATLAEIKASHRKRVLKCHPDKILDLSPAQQIVAQEEFQRVQCAYELLSDPVRRERYDTKARLTELKRDLDERRRAEAAYSPRGTGSHEMREGHIVEERVPFNTYFEDEPKIYEEPQSYSRKQDDYVKRPKAKEEKKKPRTPVSSERAAKEMFRETAKATMYEQSRRRGKERRGQRAEKYDSFDTGPRVVLEDSDSSDSEFEKSPRPSKESRARPSESSRRRERDHYDDDKYDHHFDSKLNEAEQHIERTRVRSSPQRSRGYESPEPETASRRAGRSSRSNQHPSSRDASYEDLPRFERPKMSTSATSPSPKTSSLRPSLLGRSATAATAAGYVRTKQPREGSIREEKESPLHRMVYEAVPRASKSRDSKYDSGYSSSSPNTDMPTKSAPAKVQRYKIDAEHTIIEPPSSKSTQYRSPDLDRERAPRVAPPKRSNTTNTYTTYVETEPRVTRVRPRTSRTYDEADYPTSTRKEDVRYTTREIRPPTDASATFYSTHIRSPRRPAVH